VRALFLFAAVAACGGGHPVAIAPTAAGEIPPPVPSRVPLRVDGVGLPDRCASIQPTPRSIELFDRACAAKDGEACSELSRRYLCGIDVAQDLARAAALEEQACDLDFIPACAHVAQLTAYPQAVVEPAAAFRDADKGCKAGDPDACVALGVAYLQGLGTPPDPARAAAIFTAGCERGDFAACSSLAMQTALGLGVAKDLPRAAALAERACGAGMPLACHTLGSVKFEQGDVRRAEALLAETCALPARASSCDNLGLLYARGGVRDKAAAAFRRGCEQAYAPACTHLGQLMSVR
jgi:TPR repeat protein